MIGTALKRIRTIFDYSAAEMSEQLGISRSYLSEIENNSKQPSIRLLERYSEVTGIRLSSIMLLSEQFGEVDFELERKITSRILNSLIEKMAVMEE